MTLCQFYMSSQKAGIRVRHVHEPEPEVREPKEGEPNFGIRKKIFEKLPPPTKSSEPRVNEEPRKRDEGQASNKEYEMLVDNLKKKTMELELRDSMIGSLNRQLDEAKRQLRIKDKQINRLKQEIQQLQRYNQINRDKESAFPPVNQQPAFRSTVIQQQKPWNIPREQEMGQSFTHGDISVMNINKPSYQAPSVPSPQEDIQILSPFMALSNHRKEAVSTFNSQVTVKNHEREPEVFSKTANSLVNPFQKEKNFTQYGSFYKAKENQEFNFNSDRQQRYSFTQEIGKQSFSPPIPSGHSLPSAQEKPPVVEERPLEGEHHTFGGDSINNQLQKFNIFGQVPGNNNPSASRVSNNARSHKGMSIDHSREFNFSELDNSELKGFGNSSYAP